MTVYKDVISIFGGTSFLGLELIRTLVTKGWSINLFTLDAARTKAILTRNNLLSPKIKVIAGYGKISSEIIESSYFVINLMQGPMNFAKEDIRYQKAFKNLIEVSAKQKNNNFIHLSCLGANSLAQNNSYLKEKGRQEDSIRLRIANHTILRTGILFGNNDFFFNHYADYFRYKSILYLPKEARNTIWYLTYVGDVVLAISKIINQPKIYTSFTYNLYSEKYYRVNRLMKLVSYYTGFSNCSVVILPETLLKIFKKIPEFISHPKIDPSYKDLVKTNFVPRTEEKDKNFLDLNIKATLANEVMPLYLFRN